MCFFPPQKVHEMLKKGWDAEGSPFRGQQFDPSMFDIPPSAVQFWDPDRLHPGETEALVPQESRRPAVRRRCSFSACGWRRSRTPSKRWLSSSSLFAWYLKVFSACVFVTVTDKFSPNSRKTPPGSGSASLKPLMKLSVLNESEGWPPTPLNKSDK